MNQPEVMKKAAALFAEWKEGDEFELHRLDYDPTEYQTIPPDQVVEMLQHGCHVRLKPKPVRTVRKLSAILADAEAKGSIIFPLVGKDGHAAIRCDSNQCNWILIDRLAFWIGQDEEKMRASFEVTIPDWFFETTNPATPSTDRIAEMAQTVASRYAPADTASQRVLREQLARLIREECTSRGIT